MPEYQLVNPRIIGALNDTVEASNQLSAAEKAWKNISDHVTNNVPRFVFTLRNMDTNELYTFKITEKPNQKMADYSITELNDKKLTKEQKNKFKNELKRSEKRVDELLNKMKGGRKKRYKDIDKNDDEDEDDDDDSDELYEKVRMIRNLNTPLPIVYWWYDPVVYKVFELPSIYIPTFNAPLVPYVELNLSSAYLG